MQKAIPCSIYRGGTSKALILAEEVLPPAGEERDKILVSLIGGPDPKQIDGLGGATVPTSKVAIIKKSSRPGIDIDYTFAQVVLGTNQVDYKANCGNISSAVGPYSIENKLVEAKDGITKVAIYNTNTDKTIVAVVETPGKKVSYEGDFAISGVNGTGSKIELQFLDPGGAATGKILPTGSACETLKVPRLGDINVSVVDASNLFIFVEAKSVGLRGNEKVDEIDGNSTVCEHLETIRGMIAEKLGYVDDYKKAFEVTPAVPKIAVVSGSPDGNNAMEKVDIYVRMMSMKKTHKTFAMTGGMCVSAASVIPGTVVNAIALQNKSFKPAQITLSHPGGLMDVGVTVDGEKENLKVLSTSGFRTAKFLMQGTAYHYS